MSSETSPILPPPDSELARQEIPTGQGLADLFADNIIAKVYRTATRCLPVKDSSIQAALYRPECVPTAFPEYVPQYGEATGNYVLRESEFWTCGFFPGTMHAILERFVRFPRSISPSLKQGHDIGKLRADFQALCTLWAEPLYTMADRRDTHDVGFIIMPALQTNWELTGNPRSLSAIIRAAKSLGSRFNPTTKAIRSWDARIQGNLEIRGLDDNFILIIDSMCNLDLLYYASHHISNGSALADFATSHASTLLKTHLRPETITSTCKDAYPGQWYSTHHVVNMNPRTGDIKQSFTAQGYSDTSTWARGQAWAILGYAQTYTWTRDRKFLDASCGLVEYFLYRLQANACHAVKGEHGEGQFVPPWDFDAPTDGPTPRPRDSSAGMIAANGMLVLSQALTVLSDHQLALRFRNAALAIARDTALFALAPQKARFIRNGDASGLVVEDEVPEQTFEAILKLGTANNNEHARKRYADHGLVYGDYYFVDFGNRLLRMGLV